MESLSFSFEIVGFAEDAILSGQFAGEDANGDNLLVFDELSDFSATFSGNSSVAEFSLGFADLLSDAEVAAEGVNIPPDPETGAPAGVFEFQADLAALEDPVGTFSFFAATPDFLDDEMPAPGFAANQARNPDFEPGADVLNANVLSTIDDELTFDFAGEGDGSPIPDNTTITPVEVPGADIDLNVDGVGGVDPFVDVLNIFRVAAGAPQAVVVTAEADAAEVTQQAIADAANALDEEALNIDNVGGFDPFVDVLNIFRVAAGAPQAVVVTAEADAAGVTQQAIVDSVTALLA